MEDNNGNFKGNSPTVLGNNDPSSSPDLNLLSPLSKSRYGRTRKPKITEDFYNIDVIFESTRELKRSPRTPQPIKSTKAKSLSPKKPIKPTLKKRHTFQHITGDDLVLPEPIKELPQCKELNSKAIHNFFKIESGMSILQNATVNNEESRGKLLSNNLNLESVDVTQVLKIISNKTVDETIIADTKGASKPILKTYSNKRKSYIKTDVVESFGLPDTPIFPSEKYKSAEPKRIKNLDVAPPTSENDINLVDKKLLDTPWKIASMDAEIPDLDIIYDARADYKEGSPTKLLNHSVSIFDDGSELETVTNIQQTKANKHQTDTQTLTLKHTPNDIKKPECNQTEVEPVREAKPSDNKEVKVNNTIVPDPNQLLPKLKKIVQSKILRHSILKVDKNKNENIVENVTPQKLPKQQKVKRVENLSPTKEKEIVEKVLTPKTNGKIKMQVKKKQKVKVPQNQNVPKVMRNRLRSKSPVKKVNPETNNTEVVPKVSVTVEKNERLLRKAGNLKPEDVSPLVKSPVKAMIKKRKRSESPKKSRSVPNMRVSDTSAEISRIFVPRRGRSSKFLQAEEVVTQIGPTLRKRLSKSAEGALENTPETSKEVKSEKLDELLQEDVPIKVEVDSDGSVEYVPSSLRVLGKSRRKRKERVLVSKYLPSDEGEKALDGTEIKLDPDAVDVGALMWAKIGGHPFWPCIIVAEPLSTEFKKTYYNKNTNHCMYHVRFFGDRGRRSWVHSLSIFPFTSKFDLKNQFEQSKNKANFIVKPSALAKWKIAVKEAELQLNSTVEQRLDFFNQVLAFKKKINVETIGHIQASEIKREMLEESENEAALKYEEMASKLRSRSSVVTDKKKEKNKQDPIILDDEKPAADISNDVDKKGRAKSLGNMLFEKKKMKGLKIVIDETSSLDAIPLHIKEQSESGSESTDTAKHSWKSFSVEDRNLDANSEYSLSDTDSVSKSSSSTPIPNSFQEQVTRQRRNNLFRGVSRDLVCQVCKVPNEVFKCKGPCNGMYHYSCAIREPKKDEVVQEGVPDSTQSYDGSADAETAKVPEPLTLAEQIDMKMKEVMQNLQNDTRYADSTTDYSSSEESNCNQIAEKTGDVSDDNLVIRHVTADHISFMNDSSDDLVSSNTAKLQTNGNGKKVEEGNEVSSELSNKEFQCRYCLNKIEPPCYACGKEVSNKNESLRQKCSLRVCGKYYHPKCLKLWPQTQWSLISTEKHRDSEELLDTFVCPLHVCHTCASDDPHAAVSRCVSRKVAKCLCCPATYHTTNYCIPAGTQILSISQIVCPRHFVQEDIKKTRSKLRTVNTPWCFICSKGGDLICCETCPTSVHTECLTVNFLDDDTFICEDCETGRFPLYDEIVWVKLGKYRWWPAVILFPNEVPHNVKIIPHNGGEFVVKFFGTHDHYWVGRGRVFLFQEGDKGHCSPSKRRVDTLFKKSIEEATVAHNIKKIFRKNKEAEMKSIVKPPPYIKVKINKPVGNVRQFDGNVSNTTSCECNPLNENPCGPDSDCINRLLLTECDPNVCPAKEKCNNQRFEKRQYPPLTPYKTQGRGWGLKTLASIAKGDFVIEYVGEIIDDQEYQRRIRKMHEQKDENYYFLTIDKERIIDAGPKGNLARFMNHCCQPNCETQKWTVNGDTRVGLFAIEDIAADSELTFNYNLECIGKEKKICKCGAPNCSGFIGVKVKDESQKKVKKSNSIKKKKVLVSQVLKNDGPCFVCGNSGEVAPCHNKICTKFYHLHCVNLESWPEGKWVCPWHNCNVCTKRTIRCCVKCTNSYCPVHSEGNVRYDKLIGFVCSEHDSTKEAQEPEPINQTVNKFKCTDVTEETDVTSTTCDEIDQNSTTTVVTTTPLPLVQDLGESFTSTPIKNSNVSKSLQELEENLNRENLEIPESSIPEETTASVKRKKRRGKKGWSHKKLKLSNSLVKPIQSFSTSNLIDVTSQNEVKLCASIPTRHLRTRSDTTKIANKRFLGQQSELEKDLPIRKRSRPRCEVTN